jgi:hypothetical protein
MGAYIFTDRNILLSESQATSIEHEKGRGRIKEGYMHIAPASPLKYTYRGSNRPNFDLVPYSYLPVFASAKRCV